MQFINLLVEVKEASFDAILSTSSTSHNETVLSNIAKVLKPAGTLVLREFISTNSAQASLFVVALIPTAGTLILVSCAV